ncbi:MAG: helix-turn-helix domain-containing protein [Gracilibacteraceae bacterium]|nr:helix-turn-helix domain-containing protein [Gracilibacteraceae bacterium]
MMGENGNKRRLMDIGWKVKKARENMGLTQEQFAAKFGYARTTLAKLEAGLRDFKSTEIATLAEQLNVSCDYLLGRSRAAAPDDFMQEVVSRFGLSEAALQILSDMPVIDDKENWWNWPGLSEATFQKLSTIPDEEDSASVARIWAKLDRARTIQRRAVINLLLGEHLGQMAILRLSNYFFADLDEGIRLSRFHWVNNIPWADTGESGTQNFGFHVEIGDEELRSGLLSLVNESLADLRDEVMKRQEGNHGNE